MKFITQAMGPEDPNGNCISMLEHLSKDWAGDTRMVTASFWFWAAGSRLQRSLLGLYRTLLFHMLQTDASLCHIAFPHWQQRFKAVEPTMEMVTAGMRKVLQSELLRTKFLFVVDGMDEYENDSMGKADLAWLMRDMTVSSRVKLLVSSRPEAPFRTELDQCPSLRLETLTRPDITEFVETKLLANSRLRSVPDYERDEIKEIANLIINHAQGVFLWVALVLRLTLDGIIHQDEPSTIRDRIMLLPRELNEMFNHILMERIPERHRKEAFRYLLIARQCVTSLDSRPMLDVVMVAAQEASTYEKACELATSDPSRLNAISIDFRNRLSNRCEGLLECNDSRVDFLHRSLFDYLDEEVQDFLLESEAGGAFDVNTAIMAGLICGRKRFISTFSITGLVQAFFRFNKLAERSSDQHRGDLVDTFDRSIADENATIGRSLKDPSLHWSNHMFSGTTTGVMIPKSDLLALSAFMDSTLYIKEAIQNGKVSGIQSMSLLLYFATLPYASPDFGPFLIPDDQNGTPRLLLANGADPAHFYGDWCPWTMVLRDIVERPKSPRLIPWIQSTKTDRIAAALRLLALFALYAPDLPKCRTMRVQCGATKSYTALDAIQELVFNDICCRARMVRDCGCLKARMWRMHGSDAVRLLENPTAGMQSSTSPTHTTLPLLERPEAAS